MVRSLIRIAALLVAFLPICASAQTRHMTAALDAGPAQIAPGGNTVLALTLTPEAGWHTYWRNPGDTGLATDITVTSDGAKLDSVQWPTPQKLTYDGVVTYGYDAAVTAYLHVRAGTGLTLGARLPLAVHVEALVCRDTCQPVSYDLKTALRVVARPQAPLAMTGLPVTISTPAVYTAAQGKLRLDFTAPQDAALQATFRHPQGAYVFSEADTLIPAAAPQTVTVTPQGFSVSLPISSAAPLPAEAALVVRFADGQAVRVIARHATLPTTTPHSPAPQTGLVLAMALAFLGGLILNLMPCVFPVLSMKLLALTRAGHDKAMARREALIYGLGAVLSFVGLALLLDLARGLGAMLGWGFQLQSPFVTAGLSLLMLMVGFNLSGLFEVGGSLQAAAGAQDVGRHPYVAAFMTGVLAVVVAAPCSAPFMATATGVALMRGGLVSIAIFTALGLGFAAPFVAMTFAITWSPALAKRLPRPGVWMDRLRQGLAIPMYLTAAWMAWVFWQQAGPAGLGLLVLGMALIAAALVLRRLPKNLRAAAAVAGLALAAGSALQTPAQPVSTDNSDHIAFSQDKLDALRAQGQPVLVDMTAAWCLTCKVNERVALDDARVKAAFKARHVTCMIGDWTHRDAGITRYLAGFQRSGVPLYVYYAPGQDPKILPQILTPDSVIKTLQETS